ncbi:MAG: DUF3299 domain-containing protein [Phycisphaerales bacterium]|nr:DUF3299 domain-containing protein [Phycisphaerales bacterium]
MRTFWITILLVVCAGAVALWLVPHSPSEEPVPQPAPPPPLVVAPPAGKLTEVLVGVSLGLDQQIKDATVRPGKLLQEAGSISADGIFHIAGSGTPESPYEVSWELLVSASDTYIPRLGEKVIPQRIAMLNGKHVRVSGFIAFPLVTSESDECLVMLNQWDGCCIGVPPSPYDAIEVKLAIPADNSKRHMVRVGTIEGILHVDPYLVERWLVGLYTMDGATLSSEM